MANEIITKEELEFIELWYTPKALTEILFHDWDNFSSFDEDKFGELRLYQHSMVSDESIIDFELTAELEDLDKTEAFQFKKTVGDIYNFGARKFGKSLVTVELDLINDMLTSSGDKVALSSVDHIHIKRVLDPVKLAMEFHPICKMFPRSIKSTPDFEFNLKNNYKLNSVNANEGCFDDKTEILTNNGWKSVYTIKDTDLVLSKDHQSLEADYYSIDRIVKYHHKGDMIHLQSKALDFYFTPDHRFYYNWDKKQDWQIKPINDLITNKNSYIQLLQKFELNEKQDSYIVPKFEKYPNITQQDWLEFLGWFISEGHLSHYKNDSYKIVITQHKNANPFEYQKICNLLLRMQIKYWICKEKQIVFSCKEVYDHLKKHCYKITSESKIRTKSVYCAYNKCIPNYAKNLSRRLTSILLNSLWLGDGSEEHNRKRWNTSSKQLADDMQIAILSLGMVASISTKQKNRNPLYVVSEIKRETRSISGSKHLSVENWDNLVWCVETNPHGLIYVRRNGRCMWTGNSKNPGGQWLGLHVSKVYLEEASLESETVYEKRKDALSEVGAVFRVSGMTDFTAQSPAGQMFYSAENHKQVLCYPQYISPFWNEKQKAERLEQYGGEFSVGYRVYVKGEVVSDGISVFDMTRVRNLCVFEKKSLKNIEITKDRYKHYKQFIIVDRPAQTDRIFIDADIGLHVTEINIMMELNQKYEYLYNISLYGLTDDEQANIFKTLIEELEANVIAIDCGDGQGRAIYNELEKTVPQNNLVWYDGSKKIQVGFETNKDGNPILENGKPIYKYELMAEWAVKRLKDLFYRSLIVLPEDYKLLTQLSKVIGMKSGSRTIFKCICKQGDHLFDSFRVFAIAEWLKANAIETPKVKKKWGTGATN